MATSNAQVYLISQGTTFSLSTDGATYTPVAQLKSASFSGSKLSLEDTTTLDSTSGYRQWAPTLKDSGTVSLSGLFSPSDPGQLALSAAFEASVPLYFKLVFPPQPGTTQTTGLTRSFQAFVSEKPSYSPEVSKTVSYAAELTVTGPITDTPATS